MKLLLIRHGDPDYTIDSLTEKGHREAQLLAEKMKNVPVKDFYVSPLGRARATADYTLKKVGRKATVLDWMEEFPAFLNPQESQGLKNAYGTHKNNQNRVIWDMLPEYWTNHPEFCTKDGWRSTEAAQMSNMPALYDRVAKGLDELLASHGYHREGNMYRTEKGNEDTSCSLLPLRRELRHVVLSLGNFTLYSVAFPDDGSDLCDRAYDGGERRGKGIFPCHPHRGYLSSLCRRRGACLRRTFLRNL